jgi:hypothetical protein
MIPKNRNKGKNNPSLTRKRYCTTASIPHLHGRDGSPSRPRQTKGSIMTQEEKQMFWLLEYAITGIRQCRDCLYTRLHANSVNLNQTVASQQITTWNEFGTHGLSPQSPHTETSFPSTTESGRKCAIRSKIKSSRPATLSCATRIKI